MSNSDSLVLHENLTALRAQLVPMIRREMKRHHLTGLSLALVDGAGVAWAEGFGYADKEQGVPATPETVFKICSISKLFTATAAMQLVEQGKLDLDRPVQSYIPEFSIQTRFPQSEPITVRSLMTHHSGLPVDNRRSMYAADADHDPESFQTALDYLNHTFTAYPVDYIFSYSNLAIDVLGILIERVSGERFESYVTRHILKPLGMETSSVRLDETTRRRLSKGYHLGKGMWEPMLRDIPAGGVHSTALDMARFIGMVNGQGTFAGISILRAETLAQMLTPQNTGNPLDFNLAIGLNWALNRPALEYAVKYAAMTAVLNISIHSWSSCPNSNLAWWRCAIRIPAQRQPLPSLTRRSSWHSRSSKESGRLH
jgi:CubicO group peptidase (beta-lactamase class C family)